MARKNQDPKNAEKRKSPNTKKKSREMSTLGVPSAGVIKAEIKREKYKQLYKKVLRSTVYTLIIVAAIAVLIATLLLPVVQITGTSMEPSLVEGDIVALIKTDNLERGDLCAFYYSNKILIKRVIGKPGDVIIIDTDGTVYVNGTPIDEPYITDPGFGECDIEFPFTVPSGEYFMMGDKRQTSIDSRNSVIGTIPTDEIVGKIFLKIWPLNEFKFID